ncbi:phosphoribosylanthranilate isomerase [Mycoavidus sp. B2-EB]|uniref:phosphoribosylanthranilate isomerase n=1 Tax=Mycoavidus sp. B2-EB TaxID=2651972 RepID=UPI001628E8FD|nr:phosphoribosylanthranilate isomerase [Mycoavidus sp. B2-EB]BBO60120.1 N-(5'-phosphoribosyl)anthranilate isomerase [Mycoavidus sp. B2-EB]
MVAQQLATGLHARTRIKFCGLTRPQDIEQAVSLGVDAIGFVFYPASARALSFSRAAELARYVPPFVSLVGLFVNPDAAMLRQAIEAVPLSIVQFHGDETPAQCLTLAASVRLPWLRALHVNASGLAESAALLETAHHYAAADGLLLDTFSDGYGGSGQSFDWSCIPTALASRIILSGGLNAENIRDAIMRVRPYAVDVSTGIEVLEIKGVKDHSKMAAFMRAVKAADSC